MNVKMEQIRTSIVEVLKVSERANSGPDGGSGPTGSPKEEPEPEETLEVALGSTFSLSS